MNTRYTQILLIALITCITTLSVFTQSTEKSATRMQVAYFNEHNKSENIVVTLKIREDQYVPFEDAEIQFYCINDTSKVLLGKLRTDSNGEAIYIIKDDDNIYKDSSGLMTFEVEYNGSPTIKSASKDLEVKALNLKMSFFQEDTVKYISVEANEIGPDKTTTPIEELEIALYIKGTFSLLPIGTEVTDQNGKLVHAFPVHMPGDTLGVLTIVAKIDDHDFYGTVESQGDINWGQPVPLEELPSRGLGDTDAPLWMVYTLIILLSAVWFHYLFVVYLIVKIKRARSKVPTLE